MSRAFEKISYEQFKKDISPDIKLYNSIEIPIRSTLNSAGYDIKSMYDGIIKPGKSMAFKTGLKVAMNGDEVLYIYSRSSFGYKFNVTMVNSVGVIDSDFYNNEENEGHFSVCLINHGESDFEVKIGDRIAQGVFMKYLTVDDEEKIDNKRIGGLGSTDRR